MIIKRDLISSVTKHLGKKEISLIVGPRQAGKTWLMEFLQAERQRRGIPTLFLSLDFEPDQPFFRSQEAFLKKCALEFGVKRGLVFIDEIQRKENAGLFLKGLYDRKFPHKMVVSGSGSLELKEKIHESLAGRKRVFELIPVSFSEFVSFKTNYRYEHRLNDFFELEREKTGEWLREYLNFGGYPRVILEEQRNEKLKIINEIYQSYLEKDISYLLKIDRIDAFRSLIKVLASQMGKLLNYSELSNTLGISVPTVKNYLWYAEKTFILQRIYPFFSNTRKEITKSPILYFHDLGLRNYALGIFGTLQRSDDVGWAFQNLVFHLVWRRIGDTGASLHFWRTKDHAEVDFVLSWGRKILPIEVKYQEFDQPQIGRSLNSFIEHYRPGEGWVVTKNYQGTRTVQATQIRFVPFWKLIGHRLLF